MSDEQPTAPVDEPDSEDRDARFRLIWDVVLFQFKLAADGLRDVVLVPISLGAGIWGLIAGGDEPSQYFRRLQRFGRRTDVWINLFGQHSRGPTSDNLIKPLEETIYKEYRRWPDRTREVTRAPHDSDAS